MSDFYAIENATIYIDGVDTLHNGFKLTRSNDKTLLTVQHECFQNNFGLILKKILSPIPTYFEIKVIFNCINDDSRRVNKEIKLWGKLSDGDIYDYDHEEILQGNLCFEILDSELIENIPKFKMEYDSRFF